MTTVLLLLAVLAPDEEWTPPRTMTLAEPSFARLELSAKGWYAMPSGWLLITQGSQTAGINRMDLGSDVDLDPKVVPAFDGRLHLGARFGIGLRYARVAQSGTRMAAGTFNYRGETFDAGREVRAETLWHLLEGDIQYTFNPADRFRVGIRAGAFYWKYYGNVQTVDGLSPEVSTRREFDSAFWLGGVDLAYRATPFIDLRASGEGAIQRKHQNFFRVDTEAVLLVADRTSLTAGYRWHSIRFRQSTNRSNYTIEGPTLGVEFSF